MTMVCGIDLNTRRLDCAIVPIDVDVPQTVTFRTEHLTKTTDEGTRYREIHDAVRKLTKGHHRRAIPGLEIPWDITSCWVEAPRGPYAVRQLNGVYGAVMASIPPHIARASITPQEWRRELGMPRSLTKTEAIQHARAHLMVIGQDSDTLDEHQAEALLVALAGRAILWRHDAATG